MSPAPLYPRPLGKVTAAITEQLHLAIAEQHRRVPCVSDPHPGDWTSDNPAAQKRAANACGGCPVIGLCRDFAFASHAEGVVLGGRFRPVKTSSQAPASEALPERNQAS